MLVRSDLQEEYSWGLSRSGYEPKDYSMSFGSGLWKKKY